MRNAMKNGKKLTIKFDPEATCKMEKIEGKWGKWAIVRNSKGNELGRHRTAVGAWEGAYLTLKAFNKI